METNKKNYKPLIGSLYTNFIFQGMVTIILSQNLLSLKEQWQATTQEITLVISAIGLGRLLSLFFAGYFSDKFGRKKSVQIGIICYLIFFTGILISQNYWQGLFFTLFAGFSNAFLDTSTYPTLMEAYPDEKDSSSLSVLNKAFISVGQFILPLITRLLINTNSYFGFVFIGCVICLLINFIYVSNLSFPPKIERQQLEKEIKQLDGSKNDVPKFKIEGIALLIFSFTCVSTFNIFIMWVPSYAELLNLMGHADSLVLVSAYSLGSFLSVFVTSFMVKRGIQPTLLMIGCTMLSCLLLILMTVFPSVLMFYIASLGIGVFAAGGIWQLGLAVLLEFFPSGKGKKTSYYSIATSISVMITPYITGQLETKSVTWIFIFNILLTFIGVLASLVIRYRYKKITSRVKEVSKKIVATE